MRCARHHDDFLGIQPVENLEDALFQSGPPDDAVVDDDQVVNERGDGSVGNVIHVSSQVVAFVALGDERPQLDVFPNHLLNPHVMDNPAETVGHAVERHLGGVGDIGEDGMSEVAAQRIENRLRELFSQAFALLVDVAVGPAAEIDSLKGAATIRFLRDNLLPDDSSVLPDNHRLSGHQLRNLVGIEVERSLDDRTLARHHHHLVVLIAEGRTDAPRVSHSEHLTAPGQSAHHVPSVEMLHGCAQHVPHQDIVLDIGSDAGSLSAVGKCLLIKPLHLAVEPVTHQLERDI